METINERNKVIIKSPKLCEKCAYFDCHYDNRKNGSVCNICIDGDWFTDKNVGHWINNMNGTFECDNCGCKHSKSKFCPDCGKRME